MLEEPLGRIMAGENLTQDEMTSAIDLMMDGACSEGEIGLFLVGLKEKGETADEVVGAARSLRKHMTTIESQRDNLLDTCGTGGSGKDLFNISTAAALVTAAAGVPTAKHGNRAATSKSGSADVLAELGVNIDADADVVRACLDELGIAFLYARRFHPAMKNVGQVRAKLGVPTIFNLLGPLCNPAGAPFQLLGAGREGSEHLLAHALQKLGTRRSLVVRGEDGLGEVTPAGVTRVLDVAPDALEEFSWHPSDFGLPTHPLSQLRVETAAESAALVRGVLDSRPGPARDTVVLNAAAALFTAGKSGEPHECAQLAARAIDSGAAKSLLARLVERTNA